MGQGTYRFWNNQELCSGNAATDLTRQKTLTAHQLSTRSPEHTWISPQHSTLLFILKNVHGNRMHTRLAPVRENQDTQNTALDSNTPDNNWKQITLGHPALLQNTRAPLHYQSSNLFSLLYWVCP